VEFAAVAFAAVLVGGGWQVRAHWNSIDRSRHYFAYDFAHALLKSVEPVSLFMAYGDYDLFPLWYVHYVLGEQPKVILVNSNFLPATWAKDEKQRVQFLYPKGSEAVAGKIQYAEDLVKGDPGLPVYFSVIYGAIEKARLLPRGAAYQYVWDEARYRHADVMGEWARYRRWRTIRGIFDESIPKDSNTRTTLSYYAYADYRRGYVLDGTGRHSDAVRLYQKALSYPYFFGNGPAAAHASLAYGLMAFDHDPDGAIREYRLATAANPDWLPAHRSLGALLFTLHRYDEALVEFRKVAALAPDDAAAAADVRRLEPFVLTGAGHLP
jgi:tetratricopeptide (TPR) repeat protein